MHGETVRIHIHLMYHVSCLESGCISVLAFGGLLPPAVRLVKVNHNGEFQTCVRNKGDESKILIWQDAVVQVAL